MIEILQHERKVKVKQKKVMKDAEGNDGKRSSWSPAHQGSSFMPGVRYPRAAASIPTISASLIDAAGPGRHDQWHSRRNQLAHSRRQGDFRGGAACVGHVRRRGDLVGADRLERIVAGSCADLCAGEAAFRRSWRRKGLRPAHRT